MKRWLSANLDDLFYLLGAILISVGAFLLHPIAAFFTAGVFCLYFSYLIGKANS